MITVNGLLEARPADLELVAGHRGGDRLVTWAHVCDLPDPWTWVRPGDLVMTTGDGLPDTADQQREWSCKLIDVGISSLVVALRPGAPRLTKSLIEAADERSVPLIVADFQIQFADLSRIVIESTVQSEKQHIHTARRLFDVYSDALRTRTGLARRLDVVCQSLGWSVEVRDSVTGQTIAQVCPPDADREPISVAVPGRVPAELHVRPRRHHALDGSLVHHLASLIGIELEHEHQRWDEASRRGEAVLAGSLEGCVSTAQLLRELAARGMDGQPLVVAVIRSDRQIGQRPPVVAGTVDDVSPLLTEIDGELVVLAPSGWPEIEHYAHRLTATAPRLGVSAAFHPGGRLDDAYLQARVAVSHATAMDMPLVRYDDLTHSSGVLPRSVAEMRQLVERTLGPVIAHDGAHGSELLATLETFLDNNRSWKRTAMELGVHRQTLVYRLTQIERLTGLKATSSAGIAVLWSAVESSRTLSGL